MCENDLDSAGLTPQLLSEAFVPDNRAQMPAGRFGNKDRTFQQLNGGTYGSW
jgi:hypothetical protein